MWLVVLMLGGAARADEVEDPRPDTTVAGLGAVVGTRGATGPTLRVRSAEGWSLDWTLGTSLVGLSSEDPFATATLERQGRRASVATRLAARAPLGQVGRTDVLWAVAVGGGLVSERTTATSSGVSGPQVVRTSSRRLSAGTGVELDHWVSSRAVLTAGLGLEVLELRAGRQSIDDAAESTSSSQTLGPTTTVQAGLVVFF